MSFRLQQKSLILNDLERQFTALSSMYAYCGETHEVIITRFSLKSSTIYTLAICTLGLTTKLTKEPSNFKHSFGLTCAQS